MIVHLTKEIHFNAKRVNVVGCLPSLAASAAVLCRSKCVWGSVRLSPARLQTVSPWAVSHCSLTRILNQTAVQLTNLDIDVLDCTLIFTILSLLKNSLFGTLVHMTKPMGGLISKVPVQMCMEIFVKQKSLFQLERSCLNFYL